MPQSYLTCLKISHQCFIPVCTLVFTCIVKNIKSLKKSKNCLWPSQGCPAPGGRSQWWTHTRSLNVKWFAGIWRTLWLYVDCRRCTAPRWWRCTRYRNSVHRSVRPTINQKHPQNIYIQIHVTNSFLFLFYLLTQWSSTDWAWFWIQTASGLILRLNQSIQELLHQMQQFRLSIHVLQVHRVVKTYHAKQDFSCSFKSLNILCRQAQFYIVK